MKGVVVGGVVWGGVDDGGVFGGGDDVAPVLVAVAVIVVGGGAGGSGAGAGGVPCFSSICERRVGFHNVEGVAVTKA
jgi:hypothetical protein